ncbi:MAG: hypothetical protein Q9170_006004 [Blastenia crenularia]
MNKPVIDSFSADKRLSSDGLDLEANFLSNRSQRLKDQDRAAQKTFLERKQRHLKDLEAKVNDTANVNDTTNVNSHEFQSVAVSISSSIVACLKAFNQFIEEIQDADTQRPADLAVQSWQDELGRLRIWAANIGAHQKNQSSLDYRLRDSTHIRHQITRLLNDLVTRLGEARALLRSDTDDDDDVESLQGSSSEDEEPQSEIQQLQGSVATIINCLFQMSMLVRKPAQHDLRIASRKADVAHFEQFDHNHVRDKYPGADDMIVSRLGRAITRRRMYLKYRERHAMKLKQGINTAVGAKDNATSAGALSETVVTDVQSRNIDFQDNASDSGISQTSYAPTLMSGGNITIPAAPKASQGGGPFECPYCRFIITVQSTRSWNRHVFHDLQPYVCIEKSCVTPDKLYGTRHEWIHHRHAAHPVESPTQAAKEENEIHRCALCGDIQDRRDRHERHVARHLQELALFILPRNDEDSDAESAEGSDEHDGSHPRCEPEGEVYTIKCICGFDDDDGNTVLCDKCDNWQHTACYYFNDGKVLDVSEIEHRCTDCKPRKLDIRGATERQMRRRELLRRRNTSRSSESSNTASEEDSIEDDYPRSPSDTNENGATIETDEEDPDMDHEQTQSYEPRRFTDLELERIGQANAERLVGSGSNSYTSGADNHGLDANDLPHSFKSPLDVVGQIGLDHSNKFRPPPRHSSEDAAPVETDKRHARSVPQQAQNHAKSPPTCIRVHRKHLDPETLAVFGLAWNWDEYSLQTDSNYIIIKHWMKEEDQERLFEHMRMLRGSRLSDMDGQKGQPAYDSPQILGQWYAAFSDREKMPPPPQPSSPLEKESKSSDQTSYSCNWGDCPRAFDSIDKLSKHLKDAHVNSQDSHHHEHASGIPFPDWDAATLKKIKRLEALEIMETEEAVRRTGDAFPEAKKAAQKEEEEFKKRTPAEAQRKKFDKDMKERKKKEDEDKISRRD